MKPSASSEEDPKNAADLFDPPEQMNLPKSGSVESVLFDQTQKINLPKSGSVEVELANIKVLGLRNDIDLKKRLAYFIMWMLAVQTFFVFLFVLFRAIGVPILSASSETLPFGLMRLFQHPVVVVVWRPFQLDEWTFKLLIAGTLTETYFLMRIVVKHLFPIDPKDEKEGR